MADNSFPVDDLVRRRWSPRAFSGESPSPSDLASILEAGRWAPSAYNDQPWTFIVARKENQAAFELVFDCLAEGNRVWAHRAGALILAVARTAMIHNGKPNLYAWYDLGQSVAWMTVQATAMGWYVHQMAGFDRQCARTALSIPSGFEPVTVIAIGRTGDTGKLPEDLSKLERAPRTRRPLSDTVFDGTWGIPTPWLA